MGIFSVFAAATFKKNICLCGPLFWGDIFLTTFYGLYRSHNIHITNYNYMLDLCVLSYTCRLTLLWIHLLCVHKWCWLILNNLLAKLLYQEIKWRRNYRILFLPNSVYIWTVFLTFFVVIFQVTWIFLELHTLTTITLLTPRDIKMFWF